MEQRTSTIVYSERNAPKRAVVRSDGALYVLLLLMVFASILLSHMLSERFGIDRLYVLLLVVAYVIYRLRLIDYVYDLTESKLIVTQAVGSKQKQLAIVPFASIEEIGAYRPSDAKPAPHTYRGKKENTTAVWYTESGERYVLLLNATDVLKEKLREATHAGN